LGAAPGGSEYFDCITFDEALRGAYLSHGTEVEALDVVEDVSPQRKTYWHAGYPAEGPERRFSLQEYLRGLK
jgi:hypothetical protein